MLTYQYSFWFSFEAGPLSLLEKVPQAALVSTDVDLQHRDGLMAGAQAHRKQRTTAKVKGTLSKEMEVCFLQCGSPPSEHRVGRHSCSLPSPWLLMHYQFTGGGKLSVWRKNFRLVYVLCFAL